MLQLSIFDLSVSSAVERLVEKIGAPATQDIKKQAGDGLFVLFGRDGDISTHWTADETAVLEALAAGLAEVAARKTSGGLKLTYYVGQQLDAKFRAMLSLHNRLHTADVVSGALQ